MRIGDREIGWDHEPYVIAEIGVNHDGRMERALSLVDAAAAAGAAAVKTQFFEARRLLSRAARLAAYQERSGAIDPVAMLEALQLDLAALRAIVERAHARGLHAIVTVFSVELVEPATALPWDAFKSASPDLVHFPLLEALQATGRPLIVSTGAANAEEIALALARFGDAALHCVSAYPTPYECAQLGGIAALADLVERVRGQDAAPSCPVGYSDHTIGAGPGALAVAAGACLLEKHLTYDRRASGPDHAASLEPGPFAEYVRLAREAWRMRGSRAVIVQEIERDVRAVSRQSIVAARDLPAGHALKASDLTVKRPGGGLPPRMLQAIRGTRLARSVAADTPLTREDLAADTAAPAVATDVASASANTKPRRALARPAKAGLAS